MASSGSTLDAMLCSGGCYSAGRSVLTLLMLSSNDAMCRIVDSACHAPTICTLIELIDSYQNAGLLPADAV
jgi:hypothetical protein